MLLTFGKARPTIGNGMKVLMLWYRRKVILAVQTNGVASTYVVSKALSNVLVDRLYVLLAKHGIKSQFGATPGVGCQDGLFTLKTLLHQRQQHNLESYVIFADLVKAYDTTIHDLLVEVLDRYGAPPKICSVVRRLYTDLKVLVNLSGCKAEMCSQWELDKGIISRPYYSFS